MLLMPLATFAQDEETAAPELAGPLDQVVPVADEEIPDETVAAAPAPSEELLLEEFSRYRRLFQQGTLDEADIAAKRIIEIAIKVYGAQSRETASALNNLGIVQHNMGQYDAAIQNFQSSVEIIEIAEDRLHDALVNPLKGLGAAQLNIGRPDQARKTFDRAAHITRVNEGPHNLGQVEILESIAETYIRLGDTKAARNILERIHIINVKQFESNPMGLLPSLMNRATWQHRAGYFAEERSSYRRAIRIVEASSGKNSPLLVEPLRRLGESFYVSDVSVQAPQQGLAVTGELYFKRAARIAEKTVGMDRRELSTTRLALADYYVYVEAHNRAQKIYREVWELLSVDDAHIAHRNELFADPVPVQTSLLPLYSGGAGASHNDLQSGRVVVDYTVSTRGRVKNLKTESFPPEFTVIQSVVHREIRGRIFRPRVVEGEVVEANDMVFEHLFSYTQSDLDNLRATQEADSKSSGQDDERD
jgi:tetratricopeptide (TPR) repeat protein